MEATPMPQLISLGSTRLVECARGNDPGSPPTPPPPTAPEKVTAPNKKKKE